VSGKKTISISLQLIAIGLLIAILMIGLISISRKSHKQKINMHTSYKSKITVVIDAGHGGEDGGASDKSGILEKDLNLSVAKKLEELFSSAGIPTIMTRTEDKLLYDPNDDYKGRKKILDMHERVRIVSECENPVFISIHMNSFPEEQYSGLQVYYSSNDPISKELAEKVQSNVRSLLQKENERKIKCGKDIFLLDRISAPAILIECGFLSNAKEAAMLSDKSYQSHLAFCIFYAVVNEIQ